MAITWLGLPRIKYNSTVHVDFKRDFSSFRAELERVKRENVAASGVIETLNFYEREYITAMRERLTPQEIEELREWWVHVGDGTSFEFWRHRDLGGYWGFEGKDATERLKSNNEDALTFARTGTAYVTDPDTGLITSVATDTARFPEGKFGRGLMIHQAVTNGMPEPDDFTVWDISGGGTDITVSANTTETADPLGSTIADKLTSNATPGSISDVSNTAATSRATFYVWLKAPTPVTATLRIYDTPVAVIDNQSVNVTTQWQRFSVTASAAGTGNWTGQIELATTGDVVYAFGAGMVPLLYPADYIPKALGTRNKETCVLNDTSNDIINPVKGTISFWAKAPWDYNDGIRHTIFALSNVSDSSTLELNKDVSGNFELKVVPVTGSAVTQTTSASVMTADIFEHYVVTWDTTDGNMVRLYHNGTLLTTLTTARLVDINRLYVGHWASTGAIYGDLTYDELLISKAVMTQSDVTRLYNLGRGLGIPKTYWSSVMVDTARFDPRQLRGSTGSDLVLPLKEVLT